MTLRRVIPVALFLSFSTAASLSAQDLKQHPAAPKDSALVPLAAPATLEPARSPNANGFYQALRARSASGASFKVKDLTLKRDAGELRFAEGTVTLYNEVNGRVTGAVFQGTGTLHIVPPSAMERKQLKTIMKVDVLDQPFTSAVLAFTDDTAAELKAASKGDAPGTNAMGPSSEMQTLTRKEIYYNLEQRLLDDVLRNKPGGFFMANLKGAMFSKRLLYFVDPQGAYTVAPEEVGLLTSADGGYDPTLGFPSEAQRNSGQSRAGDTFSIPQQNIDVQIESNGRMTGKVTTLVTAKEDGLVMLPLNLFPTLRVSGVWGPKGEALDFIQEDKDHDSDFAVILKQPLGKGDSIAITTAYSGKDVVNDHGGFNYEVNGGARESWYPNMRGNFGNFAQYHITFHTPKNVQVVATGNLAHDAVEGKMRTSEWQTSAPIPVAGFNLGQFKSDHLELKSARGANLLIASYADENPSDEVATIATQIEGGAMGTTGMLKRATSEGAAALNIYTDFFGPLQYDHISLTQQTACNYGQSWPMVVYLPICYFWDSTIQQQLNLLMGDPTYWKVVTAHEVAHQWWGQTIGFSSYRDQWMSEGFAHWSASLYLLNTNKDQKPYREFWALQRQRILQKNAEGVRPIDVGPVVMGGRTNSSKTGNIYTSLIYPKGAYIMHSLQMLFWTAKYGDQPFKLAMHDFVNTYRNRAATTEDFKACMEKNMPPWMDIEKNHKLDWFFNAYVYGTELPNYNVTSSFEKQGENTVMHFKLSQTNVSNDFTMMVPLSIEFEDKSVHPLGAATMHGTTDVEQTVNLGKMSGSAPKRVLANYNADLLSGN